MWDAGHRDVFAYRFDWDGSGRFLLTDFGRLLGAAHGLEIPFLFDRFVLTGDADRFVFQSQAAIGEIGEIHARARNASA